MTLTGETDRIADLVTKRLLYSCDLGPLHHPALNPLVAAVVDHLLLIIEHEYGGLAEFVRRNPACPACRAEDL